MARLYLWLINNTQYEYEAKSTAQKRVAGTWWQVRIGSIGFRHNGGDVVFTGWGSQTIPPATYTRTNKAVCEEKLLITGANNGVNHAESSLILTHFGTYDGSYKEIPENEVFR